MPEYPPRASTSPQAAEPGPAPRGRGWRVALLGLIGALALALPLSQVLHLQVDALFGYRAELARLDPLAGAMAVHRGLAAHDEVADRVLRGRQALEPERRERQAGVDRELAALRQALEAGGWPPAAREASAVQGGWRGLVGEIEARRIDADASRLAHRTLQEQVLQVLDFVAALHDGSAREALAGLPRAQWPAFVAARQQELRRSIARAEAGRDAAAASLVLGIAALVALAFWLARNPARPGTAAQQATQTVRRGHGRRAGDRPASPTPADLADAELQALRRSAENTPSGG